ncbi:recombinase [Jannaschia ovalis]|uniref:Recombinase n=1 Tax=Jannaschia ovalis TaxID=3038773 RepID=A0ABY8LDI8_9RHOB|nr:recombinase [Jannaschia sp. GRR-S6-38]WGH79390.1 recombinase [Jannaschia sp. GRR-S6-38]
MFRITTAAAFAALTLPTAAAEHACTVEGDHWDLDEAGIAALYDCMSERMLAGYSSGDDPLAGEYRGWVQAGTRPAVAGPHGERFLLTFANEIAAEQYLAYEEGDFEMPVGSVLAKESIAIRDGTARVGPLFYMTKVDDAPEFDNWFYSGVMPNGKPLNASQAFCHDCHRNFDASDSMGYPVPEVRVGG